MKLNPLSQEFVIPMCRGLGESSKLENIYLYNLFAFPVIKFKFLKHSKYVFKQVKKSVRKPEGWNCELNSSYPNIADNDPIVKKKIRDELIQDIGIEIKRLFKNLNAPNEITINEFWYNIYHDNQGQEEHWHMPSFSSNTPYFSSWSGIYYNKNATPTVFCRKDDNVRFYDAKPYADSQLAPFFYTTFIPEVEDGDVIVFPPYLFHRVSTDERFKDNMRMTFAFNFSNT